MGYRLTLVLFALSPRRYWVHREYVHEEVGHDCFEFTIRGKFGKDGPSCVASGIA